MKEKANNNKKKKLLTVVIVFTVVLAVTATTWCPKQPITPKNLSPPVTPRPPDPPKPITCTEQTPHFASGCELLKHYDANNDGEISLAEGMRAAHDHWDGKITKKECKFVESAYRGTVINKLCPGCYSPPP